MALPQGGVHVSFNNQALADLNLDSNGTCSTTKVAQAGDIGTVPVEADYHGQSGAFNASSATVNEVVQTAVQDTITTVTVTPNPAKVGDVMTISVTVTPKP